MRTFVTLLLLIVGAFSFAGGCNQYLVSSRGFAVHAEDGEEQSYAGPETREQSGERAKVLTFIFVLTFPLGFFLMMTAPPPDLPRRSSTPRARPQDDDYPF